MIAAVLAAILALTAWVPIREPAGEVVSVTVRVEHGSLGDVFLLEGDNDNDTPWCGAGREVRACRVTASALTYIAQDWTPAPARCGRRPALTVTTAAGDVLYRDARPLPAGMRCAYLPVVMR